MKANSFTLTSLSASIALSLSMTAHADTAAADPVPTVVLETMYVTGSGADAVQQANLIGKTQYQAADIQNTPTINKTITEVLQQHPNVQFDREQNTAGTQGEISAGDFSINGGLYYDNKILLNNIDIANRINPNSGSTYDFNDTRLPAGSQTAVINTDLLCQLEVLDSNVDAKYGDFTGGVVKAEICIPKTQVGKIHGKIGYDYTSSDWARYNYASDKEREFFEENNSVKYQKDYKKQGLSASIHGKATDNLGLSLSASRRMSDINLKADLPDARAYNQERVADNVAIHADYQIDQDNSVKLGLLYTNSHSLAYQPKATDSRYTLDQSNYALDLSFKHTLPMAVLQHGLVYKKNQQERQVSADEYIAWRSSPAKNWGKSVVNEGTTGNPLQHNDTSLDYRITAAFDAFTKGKFSHQMEVGASLGKDWVDWRRVRDYYWYISPNVTGAGGTDCRLADGSIDKHCDSTYERSGKTVGQYHTRRNYYQAGNINLDQTRWSAFMDNTFKFGEHLTAKLGVRYDDDSLTKKATLSPRFNITYRPFANQSLGINVGANRYYGRNAFSMALQDGVNKLSWEQKRQNLNDPWTTEGNVTNINVARSELKSPFTNEYVFGIFGKAYHTDWQLKYVHRDYKDQIRRYRVSTAPLVTSYDNLGQSQSDTYSISIKNSRPIEFLSGKHYLSLGGSYTKTLRNFDDFDDSVTYEKPYVLYEGKVIANVDRPATNFNQPWRASLSLTSQFDHLKLSHQFSYRSAQTALTANTLPKNQQIVHEGYNVDTEYSKQRTGGTFNWDMNAQYTFGKTNQITIGATVKNVLNRKSQYLSSGISRSEIGRQYLAEIGIKF
ncbi:TonB-dependent receptor plug domain-containing protein [Moraxella marmotae]|uniref:TonB-dependent receptor plug domain-containing protein n=1 Tax=Moraxella marmotae TaxID=3344520 RepID=UPI0035F3C958